MKDRQVDPFLFCTYNVHGLEAEKRRAVPHINRYVLFRIVYYHVYSTSSNVYVYKGGIRAAGGAMYVCAIALLWLCAVIYANAAV